MPHIFTNFQIFKASSALIVGLRMMNRSSSSLFRAHRILGEGERHRDAARYFRQYVIFVIVDSPSFDDQRLHRFRWVRIRRSMSIRRKGRRRRLPHRRVPPLPHTRKVSPSRETFWPRYSPPPPARGAAEHIGHARFASAVAVTVRVGEEKGQTTAVLPFSAHENLFPGDKDIVINNYRVRYPIGGKGGGPRFILVAHPDGPGDHLDSFRISGHCEGDGPVFILFRKRSCGHHTKSTSA